MRDEVSDIRGVRGGLSVEYSRKDCCEIERCATEQLLVCMRNYDDLQTSSLLCRYFQVSHQPFPRRYQIAGHFLGLGTLARSDSSCRQTGPGYAEVYKLHPYLSQRRDHHGTDEFVFLRPVSHSSIELRREEVDGSFGPS